MIDRSLVRKLTFDVQLDQGVSPLPFVNDDGEAVTVNAEQYMLMLTDYLIPEF